jgi:hypothetical protein
LLLHTELVSEHGTDLHAVKEYLLADYPNAIIIHQQPLLALVRSSKMEIIKDEKTGIEIVVITNSDETTLSMLKLTYDELKANE